MTIAFSMKLLPNCLEEYKKRHDAIWAELVQLLKENGISNYHIFVQQSTNTLFAVQEQSDVSSQGLGSELIVQKWWKYMSDIMEVNEDFSPKTEKLDEVFFMA
ncbi:MAG: L-rhamnose mutarotase [Chitinophagaceae bacterium]